MMKDPIAIQCIEQGKAHCGGCLFFKPHRPEPPDINSKGECRLTPEGADTHIYRWCGQFHPRLTPSQTSAGATP